MAKTPTPATRTAVAQRGTELLALIAAAGDNGLMLTQAEGLDAINSGFAVVDTSVVENDTAKVTLTDAGRAALSGSGGAASKYAVRTDVPMPEAASQRRGRQSSYPFETMDVNASFHVPLNGENADKLAGKLNSSISGARARFASETGEQRLVTVRDYQLGEDGKPVKGEDGKRIVTGERQESRPVKAPTRDFKLAVVGADDPDGAGVRVWRTA